ncbi:NAD(P)-binding protein [Lophiostoma macrostomum CBS 122681]|uniref:NAD(P)-binding protein n=1 Tax=Lophiostoma macrostomum CBS 122681 TaxID=1314788 RepID=A0A6A6SZ25_9PLEO|nr:NAD(P)-binding protein [Lophiostoma macrostomum CBS 122681]
MSRHILVFGGTSPAGVDFCLAALRDGHTLTLFARNASKLPSEIASNVTIITGQINDASAIEKAVSCGAKTCISFIGPNPNTNSIKKGETPIADGYRIILPLLQQYSYTRTLFVSTASYKDAQDSFSLIYRLMVWFVYLFFNGSYVEITSMTPQMVALPSELNWTVFRVPLLLDGEAKPVKAGYIGEVGIKLDRKGLAEWVLREMEEGKWIGKCPALANA